MRTLDPESDYIVVRSAKDGGKHAHVMLKDLDRLLESIGQSAADMQAVRAEVPADLVSRFEALERRYIEQERAIQMLAQGLDEVTRKVTAIIDLAEDLSRRRAS